MFLDTSWYPVWGTSTSYEPSPNIRMPRSVVVQTCSTSHSTLPALPVRLIELAHLFHPERLSIKQSLHGVLCIFFHPISRLDLRLLTSNNASTPPAFRRPDINKRCLVKSLSSCRPVKYCPVQLQIQKSGLVFDDVLVKAFHWGFSVGMVPGRWCRYTSIKTNSPCFSVGFVR